MGVPMLEKGAGEKATFLKVLYIIVIVDAYLETVIFVVVT